MYLHFNIACITQTPQTQFYTNFLFFLYCLNQWVKLETCSQRDSSLTSYCLPKPDQFYISYKGSSRSSRKLCIIKNHASVSKIVAPKQPYLFSPFSTNFMNYLLMFLKFVLSFSVSFEKYLKISSKPHLNVLYVRIYSVLWFLTFSRPLLPLPHFASAIPFPTLSTMHRFFFSWNDRLKVTDLIL